MLSFVKSFIDGFTSGFLDNFPVVGEHNGILIRLNPLSGIAQSVKIFGQVFIQVNEDFFGLDAITQNVALDHEYGHIMNGDLDKSYVERFMINAERRYTYENGKVSDEELLADRYAANIHGNEVVVYALENIKSYIATLLVSSSDIQNALYELDRRIAMLRS